MQHLWYINLVVLLNYSQLTHMACVLIVDWVELNISLEHSGLGVTLWTWNDEFMLLPVGWWNQQHDSTLRVCTCHKPHLLCLCFSSAQIAGFYNYCSFAAFKRYDISSDILWGLAWHRIWWDDCIVERWVRECIGWETGWYRSWFDWSLARWWSSSSSVYSRILSENRPHSP